MMQLHNFFFFACTLSTSTSSNIFSLHIAQRAPFMCKHRYQFEEVFSCIWEILCWSKHKTWLPFMLRSNFSSFPHFSKLKSEKKKRNDFYFQCLSFNCKKKKKKKQNDLMHFCGEWIMKWKQTHSEAYIIGN